MKLELSLKSLSKEFEVDYYIYNDYQISLYSDGEIVATVPHSWVDSYAVWGTEDEEE